MADEIPAPATEPSPAPAAEPEKVPAPEMPAISRGRTLYLAKWSTRFWAWLVDIILIILFLNIVGSIFEALTWKMHAFWDIGHQSPLDISIEIIIFLLYWTICESYKGQSIGKMVLNIRVVSRDGSKIHWTTALIESLGKAFIPVLILDCLIGWLAMPGTKLRVFNRISNTIVVKTDYREPDGIVYVKDKE
jgi:Predicted membrane protein/domain